MIFSPLVSVFGLEMAGCVTDDPESELEDEDDFGPSTSLIFGAPYGLSMSGDAEESEDDGEDEEFEVEFGTSYKELLELESEIELLEGIFTELWEGEEGEGDYDGEDNEAEDLDNGSLSSSELLEELLFGSS